MRKKARGSQLEAAIEKKRGHVVSETPHSVILTKPSGKSLQMWSKRNVAHVPHLRKSDRAAANCEQQLTSRMNKIEQGGSRPLQLEAPNKLQPITSAHFVTPIVPDQTTSVGPTTSGKRKMKKAAKALPFPIEAEQEKLF